MILQRKIVNGAYANGGPSIHDRLETKRVRRAWNGAPILDAFGAEVIESRWQRPVPLPGPIWTDRYSNLLNPRVLSWFNVSTR